jgi:heptosyltransferase-2
VIYDVGLCQRRGGTWANMQWPAERWKQLKTLLSPEMRISLQPAVDLAWTLDWLNACALLVCTDGLVLHLALALGKRVIALFGPTPPEQVYLYGQGVKLTAPVLRDCSPCNGKRCLWGQSCMGHIEPEAVAEHVRQLLPTSVVQMASEPVR